MADNPFTMNQGAVHNGPSEQRKVDKWILMEQLRSRMMSDRSPYDALFSDIQSILDPHMVINDMYQAGFPDFVSDLFLTSNHLQSFDDQIAGLQEGIIPATQTWMRYGLMDEESPLMEKPEVWQYLHALSRKAQSIYINSNFYQQAPNTIRSVSRFGTGAIMMERDEETFVRFTSFPIGSYFISNNNRGIVDTFCRMFRWRVRQVIEEFCTNKKTGEVTLDNCSEALQLQWNDPKRHEEQVDIIMFVFPNPEYDSFRAKYNSKYAKYSLNYYEMARNIGHTLLREEGFHYFPIYCPRWYRQPTDAYGVDCPGAKARAPIRRMFKSIQMWLMSAQKLLEPPVGADPSVGGGVSNNGVGTTPNYLTMIPGGVGEGKKFGPIYQLNPAMLQPIKEYIDECKNEIERITNADIFRRFANDERQTPPTAAEVLQRVQEDSRVLGPIFGFFNFDWLQLMGKDLYWLMLEDKEVPPAPPAMHGSELKVEVVSRIAIALKQGDINALNAFLGTVNQVVQIKAQPGSEALNGDEAMDYSLHLLNLPPKLSYSADQLAKIRDNINKMKQQQQAADHAEKMSKVAKNLGGADTGGDSNMLQKIMEQSQGGASAT
jgi:hypothetical protein